MNTSIYLQRSASIQPRTGRKQMYGITNYLYFLYWSQTLDMPPICMVWKRGIEPMSKPLAVNCTRTPLSQDTSARQRTVQIGCHRCFTLSGLKSAGWICFTHQANRSSTSHRHPAGLSEEKCTSRKKVYVYETGHRSPLSFFALHSLSAYVLALQN